MRTDKFSFKAVSVGVSGLGGLDYPCQSGYRLIFQNPVR